MGGPPRPHEGIWVEWLVEPWATLGGSVAFVMLQIVVIMTFARRFPRYWWLPVTPIFLALAVAFSVALPYLDAAGSTSRASPALRQTIATLERQEGVDVPVDVEKVSDLTTQANAMVEGLGPTMRVVIWDTLLDGRFSLGEIRFVDRARARPREARPPLQGARLGGAVRASRSRSCSPS